MTSPSLHAPAEVAEQFQTIEQQREADLLGMWFFLATEVLLFGGLFLSYSIYQFKYSDDFAAASQELHWLLGGINTGILLTSGLSMKLADLTVQARRKRLTQGLLMITLLLGCLFLSVKGYEYSEFHFKAEHSPQMQLFFIFYFIITGLHAAHMVAGLGMMLVMLWIIRQWQAPYRIGRQIQLIGIYWAFVDMVWIFVYITLYLFHL